MEEEEGQQVVRYLELVSAESSRFERRRPRQQPEVARCNCSTERDWCMLQEVKQLDGVRREDGEEGAERKEGCL